MFYQRLKDLKEDAELKQCNVAKIIGTSENQYGRYERGENDTPLEKAILLAKYYGVSLDYIAGLTNDKKGLNKSDLSRDDAELLQKYHSLSKEWQGKIMERLDVFCEIQSEETALQKEAK